jgi:hypothetical protein
VPSLEYRGLSTGNYLLVTHTGDSRLMTDWSLRLRGQERQRVTAFALRTSL